MNELPAFWKYLIFDDDGEITGISDQAPQSEKTEYVEWEKRQIELRKSGIKV